MFTLILMTCLLSGDDCRTVEISGGYRSVEECFAASKRQWKAYNFQHRDRVVIQFMCTDDPDVIMEGKEI